MPSCGHTERARILPSSLRSSASSVLLLYYLALAHHLVKMARLAANCKPEITLETVVNGGVDHCYSDIGCFPLSAEFYHPQHRPFNVRPWHRNLIKTQFELFNRHHTSGFMLEPWNKFNLKRSGFNPKLETKIIIPGWLDNINRALWVRKLKDSLLWLWAPVNIIVVRWRNFTPYTIATANTRVVGAELANLLKFIELEMNYDRAYYHVIGHSLGAHIAGYCGDRIHGLGRITALDPARPFFQGMPKSVRLDRGDAKFVDAIHSDFTPENAILLIMSFGMTTPVGHLDFYPNGPPLFQPGCLRDTLTSVQDGIARGLRHNSLSIAFLESVRYLTACDHQRSHEWFIESITNRECLFVGVRCNEFEGMINGRCTCDDSPSACAIMGIHADQMYVNNVHEELWPVRAGSIDFKRRRPTQANRFVKHHEGPHSQMHSFAHAPALPHLMPAHLSAEDELDLEQHDESLALANQLLQAKLANQATRDEIYAQLKQQANQLQNPGEPSISPDWPFQTSETSTIGRPDAELLLGLQASKQHALALNDAAFVEYLKLTLLAGPASGLGRSGSARNYSQLRNGSAPVDASIHLRGDIEHEGRQHKRSPAYGHPRQFDGHSFLLSNLKRDIEGWYEDNSKWFLKTNNRPNYCSNQYQLLIFLGPLRTVSGRDSLRANLLVSIIGTRGQLLNQRFVPRGSNLNSFTMQPFFILLEGSYSLGQIKSLAIAWERRKDPDPVQASVLFQSNLLETLGAQVPAYQAKHSPWMPQHAEFDKSAAFRPASRPVHYQRLDKLESGAPTPGFGRRSGQLSCSGSRPDPSGRPNFSAHAQPAKNRRPKRGAPEAGARDGLENPLGLAEQSQLIDYSEADNPDEAGVDLESAASHSVMAPSFLLPQLLVQQPSIMAQQQSADGASSSEAMFVPLVDLPPPEMLNRPASALADFDLETDSNQIKMDLHNIDLHHDELGENSIVINQIILSPLEAHYGRHGRTAKAFCPPRSKRKLHQDKTVRLTPSLFGTCNL